MIIDGKKMADGILEGLKSRVQKLKKRGIKPRLGIVMIGERLDSKIYVSNKRKAGNQVGIETKLYDFPEDMEEKELIDFIKKLNDDKDVHGILVQLPLPGHINEEKVLSVISPEKDVDGLTSFNVGNLSLGNEFLAPCTPKGIIRMLERMNIPVEGKNVVIVNNSNVVGKPLALMLINRFATVTVCHVKTKNLKEHTKDADILITATGVTKLIKKDMVKEGAVVIDAGISHIKEKVQGDVDFNEVKDKVSYITPVPGGVGPMTVVMALENTLIAAEMSNK